MKSVILKFGAVLAMSAAFFFFGYQHAAALYGEDIAALREDYARRLVEVQEEYRAKERFAKESMVVAWEQRDAAYARLRDHSANVDRVRREADAARRRLSSASAATCKPEREQLARCAVLLERGGVLLRRGIDLSAKSAIDKDAVVRMVDHGNY